MRKISQCNRNQLERNWSTAHSQCGDDTWNTSEAAVGQLPTVRFIEYSTESNLHVQITRLEAHITMHQEIPADPSTDPKMSKSDDPPRPYSEFESHRFEEPLTDSSGGNGVIHPPCTAKDLGPDYYARVRLSTGQRDMLLDEAEQRDPTSQCHRHLVGITGEAGVGTLYGVPFDRRITEDYKGDNGYDIIVPRGDQRDPLRVEVKTTENWSSPERTVSYEERDQADCFVLCATHAPGRSVDIIGYAERQLLKQIGEAYGRNGYILAPEYLRPIGPKRFGPEDFRAAMQGSRRSYCSSGGK